MNKDSERQKRYDDKMTIRVGMKLNLKTDADIISKLDEVSSKQGYIKALIRKEIKNDKR